MRGIRFVALGLTISGVAVGAETAPVKTAQPAPAQPGTAQPAPPSTGQIAKKPELQMVRPAVDLAVARVSCRSALGQPGATRSAIASGGPVECEMTVRNQGTEVAYTRDITVGARLTMGGAEAAYTLDAATRQNCAGMALPPDLPGPSAGLVSNSQTPPHILAGGEASLFVRLTAPIAPGRVDGAIKLSHPKDSLGINDNGVFVVETTALSPGGLCSVEPPLAAAGQTVKLRGYFLGLEGVTARLRFGRLSPAIVRTTLNEVEVRVPAMTCAGAGTTVHYSDARMNSNSSRRVPFNLPQPQSCPAPVIASASPATVAPGGLVTLVASNVGPLDPNLETTIDFAENSWGPGAVWGATIEEVTTTQVKVRIAGGPSARTGAATLTLKNANGQARTSITVTR
jgi:hypothetical protein